MQPSLYEKDVAIFWDYENCEIPATADVSVVTKGISRIAHQYGSVKVFKAYLEASELNSPRSIALRTDLQTCGVTVIDCPHNGRKDVADKMILVDMLAHAIDYPAPSTVVLISGDRDFVYAVSTLVLRTYTVVLMAPVAAHNSLRAQASFVYEWPRGVMQADIAPMTPSRFKVSTTPSPGKSGQATPSPDKATSGSGSTNPTSQPATPRSPNFNMQVWQAQVGRSRANSVQQHNRSTSLPSNDPRRIDSHSPSASGSPARTPYSEVVSGSPLFSAFPALPVPNRKSPAWPSSRLFATSPIFEPSPLGGHSPPAPVVTVCGPPDSTEEMHDESDAFSAADDSNASVSAIEPLMEDTQEADETENRGRLPADLPPTPFANAVGLHVGSSSAEEDGAPVPAEGDEPELITVQVRPDVVIPSYVMFRLWTPSFKHRILVDVLERERLRGNTRVAYSQLGSLLRQESKSVYTRAGCAQLKDYIDLAAKDRIVLTGTTPGRNGNNWVSLHPLYHGKPKPADPQTTPLPPTPMSPPVQATVYPASHETAH